MLRSVQRVEAALQAKEAALCAAEITLDEWKLNIDGVMREVRDAERKADATLKEFMAAARLTGNRHAALSDLSSFGVPEKLRKWSERLLGLTSLVSPTPAVQMAAWHRQAKCRAPSKRGKDSHGDCTIVETLLAMGSELAPTAGRLVFLTSNTTDFAVKGKSSLHPDLAPEFTRVNAVATFNWGWAVNELLGKGP